MQQDGLLNVGLDLGTGEAVTVGEGTYDLWRAKGHSGDRSLICLYCHQNGKKVPLVISGRVGGRQRLHFKHPPGTARGGHSPETVWHADGKLLIARWARHQPGVAAAEMEWCTPDNLRRADVLLTMTGGARIAVELQSRLLTDGAWNDRHRDYQRQNIVDVWLWHPQCELPWILPLQGLPVWFLDVTERSIGIPIGRAHTRPNDWYRAADPTVFGLHHPPCVDDTVNIRWQLLDRMPVDQTGLLLPTTLARELAAGADQLRAAARHMTTAESPSVSNPGRLGVVDRGRIVASGSPPSAGCKGSGREAPAAVDPAVVDECAPGSRAQEAQARQRQREAERHDTNRAALRERQHRLTPIAVRMVTSQTGRVPWTLPGDCEHAMGVSIMEGNRVMAVVCPVASRITDEIAGRLVDVTIYVASDDERRRIAHTCWPAQRILVLVHGSPHDPGRAMEPPR